MNPKVDEYFDKIDLWKEEQEKLREILLDCGLIEELKWGVPCYMYQKSNIALIHSFKKFCGIGFFKGSLLSDIEKILTKPGENSQEGRQLRFTSTKEIIDSTQIIKAYIFEAIELEKAGIKLIKPNEELVFVEELQNKLNSDSNFKSAFEALTQGRQRAYNIYFSEPKQSKTRESRIENYTSRILIGKGFNDCICGLSKRMPNCDGSHKLLEKK